MGARAIKKTTKKNNNVALLLSNFVAENVKNVKRHHDIAIATRKVQPVKQPHC